MRADRKRNLLAVLCLLLCVGMLLLSVTAEEEQESLPQLVIGGDEFEPYVYFNVDGKPQGLDVELAVEACRRLGYEPVFKTIRWEEKDACLESGEIDCLWNCLPMTGRQELYTWAGPYLFSQQIFVVRTDSGITDVSQLKGRRVAVQASTYMEEALLTRSDVRLPVVGAVYSFSTVNEVYAALRRGYVDAITGDQHALEGFVRTAPEKYMRLKDSAAMTALGVAFQKGTHEELAQQLTQVLADMVADGTAAEIVSRYGLDADEVFFAGRH